VFQLLRENIVLRLHSLEANFHTSDPPWVFIEEFKNQQRHKDGPHFTTFYSGFTLLETLTFRPRSIVDWEYGIRTAWPFRRPSQSSRSHVTSCTAGLHTRRHTAVLYLHPSLRPVRIYLLSSMPAVLSLIKNSSIQVPRWNQSRIENVENERTIRHWSAFGSLCSGPSRDRHA
jgi:hypothetical protein